MVLTARIFNFNIWKKNECHVKSFTVFLVCYLANRYNRLCFALCWQNVLAKLGSLPLAQKYVIHMYTYLLFLCVKVHLFINFCWYSLAKTFFLFFCCILIIDKFRYLTYAIYDSFINIKLLKFKFNFIFVTDYSSWLTTTIRATIRQINKKRCVLLVLLYYWWMMMNDDDDEFLYSFNQSLFFILFICTKRQYI